MPTIHGWTLEKALNHTLSVMRNIKLPTHRGSWQGTDVSKHLEMKTFELCHHSIRAPLTSESLDYYRALVAPNLPWADDHFAERVGGHPLNPGTEWRNWPWGLSASKFRLDPASVDDPGTERVFDHTYAQRLWPKFAGMTPGGILPADLTLTPRRGIYFSYGDLADIVSELVHEPTTRQAVLPMFSHEDTGHRPGRRKPCSLSWHFLLVDGALDMTYILRSCDLVRHLLDDVYLAIRLQLWMLRQLRQRDSDTWSKIKPGMFICHIGNLHLFVNDRVMLDKIKWDYRLINRR